MSELTGAALSLSNPIDDCAFELDALFPGAPRGHLREPSGSNRITRIEVVPVLTQSRDRHAPARLGLLPIAPPSEERLEFFELEWSSLGLATPPLRQLMFVLSDYLGRPRSIKEQDFRWNGRIERRRHLEVARWCEG